MKRKHLILLTVSALFLLFFAANLPVQAAGLDLAFDRIVPYKNVYINGLKSTLQITMFSLLGGLVLGILLSVIKVSGIKPLKLLAQFYTSIFRGTPLLVQVFIVYFATPQLTNYEIPAFNAAVIAFSLNSAAYISEILRGGIEAVDVGQMEAALSLGVSKKDTMIDIIIPQALKTVLPALVNETIALLKESSLVSTIGMLDLMRSAQVAMNATYLAFEPFIVVALIYYVLVMILNTFAGFIERRLKRSDRY
ncbi:amino acid ABC transporter permease [Enterococcus florum]|nr:amino acid ABC transporter permease [Enterococcus florum]